MINSERLRQTFLELLEFNAPPGEEREVSRYCGEALQELGFVCQRDAAGNLLAQKAGSVVDAPRIFFSAHLDTVEPTAGLVVREVDGVFHTSGQTILGADDRAGLAEILEGLRALDESGLPHGDLQVIFSTREEIGLVGARALSPLVIAGSLGFVFDTSGRTGAIITAAPTHETFTATFRGRAAHAGAFPEKGISAIRMAARAVDRMSLGRIDPETTANAGTLHGGTADNVVAAEAVLTLEARSRSLPSLEAQAQHMRDCLEEAAAFFGGEVEIDQRREYQGYTWSPEDLPVRIAADAWRRVATADGREPELRPTGGGSDASVFNARGVPTVVLSCGYLDAHTTKERIALQDLVEGAEWVVRIAERAAGGSA